MAALLGDSPTGREQVLEYSGRVAIRQGQWKFIPRLEGAVSKQGSEASEGLYHLGNDPAESDNIAAQHPELVEKLSRELAQSRERGRSRP
jgi:arylsulfatase A-like enzyme